MSPLAFLLIPLIFVIAIAILFGVPIFRKEKEKQRKLEAETRYYEINRHCTEKAYSATSYKEAKQALDTMKANYPGSQNIYHSVSKKVYKQDLQDVRNIVREYRSEEKADWKNQAKSILLEFYAYFRLSKNINFDCVENIKMYTEKCLKWWDEYFSLPPNEFIDAKNYLKQVKPDEFEPCMLDRDQLQKRLESFIEVAEPIRQNKLALYKQIRTVVGPDGISRAELLRHTFERYTDQEVKYAYESMRKKGSLKEQKNGNHYYVTLRKR